MIVFNDIFKDVDDLLNWFIKWLYYIDLLNGYINQWYKYNYIKYDTFIIENKKKICIWYFVIKLMMLVLLKWNYKKI